MSISQLMQMLSWMTPSGSEEAEWFAETYIRPTMGYPNQHGNFIFVMGKDPKVAFAAHYDTVHSKGGLQDVTDDGKFLTTRTGDCLGADCKTGIWIILNMIREGIPGVYCIFADEEIGCIGSGAEAVSMQNDPTHPLNFVDAMISFDRFGTSSIITHQMGVRTASDEFAESLSKELEMDHVCDPGGSYTDSNEFALLIPECTNLSVGYGKQHTSKEYQDTHYLLDLMDALRYVEWDKLVISRDPAVQEPTETYEVEADQEADLMECLIYENVEGVAELLAQLGYTSSSLIDELQVEHPWYSWGRVA